MAGGQLAGLPSVFLVGLGVFGRLFCGRRDRLFRSGLGVWLGFGLGFGLGLLYGKISGRSFRAVSAIAPRIGIAFSSGLFGGLSGECGTSGDDELEPKGGIRAARLLQALRMTERRHDRADADRTISNDSAVDDHALAGIRIVLGGHQHDRESSLGLAQRVRHGIVEADGAVAREGCSGFSEGES
jgi:hypothetical protein